MPDLRPAAAVGPDAAELRLPADRRSACCPGFFDDSGPEETIQVLLAAVARGDLAALPPLLDEAARKRLDRLIGKHGAETVGAFLRRRCRTLCDCRVERMEERPDGTAECRLRIFRLRPGGRIASFCWLVEARRSGDYWQVSSFDPIGLIRRASIRIMPAGRPVGR